tara:strand:+ start:110 stop:571 length:462 start_codon:yes stop_codon:yes gene_type:complete
MEFLGDKTDQLNWDYPNPYTVKVKVLPEEIDQLGHANNRVYLNWIMKAAYTHSESLGLSVDDYLNIGVAMVAKRHELNYIAATFVNDELIIGTWIATNDNRFNSQRNYQIIRLSDDKTILRAETDWVSVNIQTGKPQRMPEEFIQCYKPTILP